MKILLVEDQLAFANMLARLLEGLDIHHVETMAEAREWLSDNRADLILLDLGLSDSQGLGTLRALKDIKTPKVVISGRFDISSEAYHEGAIDYIPKTTQVGEIVERVMFNVAKVRPRKRFSDNVFSEIRACFEQSRAPFEVELTTA